MECICFSDLCVCVFDTFFLIFFLGGVGGGGWVALAWNVFKSRLSIIFHYISHHFLSFPNDLIFLYFLPFGSFLYRFNHIYIIFLTRMLMQIFHRSHYLHHFPSFSSLI